MAAPYLIDTPIRDCVVIRSIPFQDMRGVFMESWNRETFSALGLPIQWPQDNYSRSEKSVLRGLHIQRRRPQGKLVSCYSGAVLDVALDLRPGPTQGKWFMQRLELGVSLYVPPGCAHGFLALEPQSIVYYKCTTLYDRESDGGVNVLGGLGLPPEFTPLDAIQSEKDLNLPSLEEWLADPRGLTYE